MSSSLSNIADNLSEGIYNYKCTNCNSYLDYMITKDDQLIFRCFEYKNNYKNTLIKIYLKDLQVYMNFVIEILINSFCY